MSNEIKFKFGNMLFTWDEEKAIRNWKKHKVTFRRAAEVFADSYAIDVWDIEHNEEENRRSIIGQTTIASILFVVYVDRITQDGKDIYRIISARPANRKEKKMYECEISR